MKNRIKYDCPYCGAELDTLHDTEVYLPRQLITHDWEDGGCDGTFVLETKAAWQSQKALLGVEVSLIAHPIPTLAPVEEVSEAA